ncbi:50S ribosomal protein L31 [Candidatus Bipolaricaulota bacterium]|nr:50S ribosomal protein L31 [Candidatus Bipolaricaulota bacterium]
MKKDIHPEMKSAAVKCGCGAQLDTISTVAEMRVDICSKCHPFFTGEERLLDTEGRVERFQRKYGKKEA